MLSAIHAEHVLERNYRFISKLSPYCTITRNINVILKTGDRHAIKNNIEAETHRNKIIVYTDVMDSLYKARCTTPQQYFDILCHIISHEFWHIFQARFKFYAQLEKIITGKRPPVNKLNRIALEDFVNELNSMSEDRINSLINDIQQKIKGWDNKYILAQAKEDSKKPFIARIKNPYLQGIIEELFAEKYAEKISKLREVNLPVCFTHILNKLFGTKVVRV